MVDLISFCSRVALTIWAIIIMGLLARIDTQIDQGRVKYILAVGVIGTALEGLYGLPVEFIKFRANRWILAVIDTLAWMLLFAAAVIASDDIHVCNEVANLGLVSFETCHLVKAATAFAWVGFTNALLLSLYDFWLIRKNDDAFGGARTTPYPPQTTTLPTTTSTEAKEETVSV